MLKVGCYYIESMDVEVLQSHVKTHCKQQREILPLALWIYDYQ